MIAVVSGWEPAARFCVLTYTKVCTHYTKGGDCRSFGMGTGALSLCDSHKRGNDLGGFGTEPNLGVCDIVTKSIDN